MIVNAQFLNGTAQYLTGFFSLLDRCLAYVHIRSPVRCESGCSFAQAVRVGKPAAPTAACSAAVVRDAFKKLDACHAAQTLEVHGIG
jgi:hypothetical protein